MTAVSLYNPKFEANVAAILRTCSCWGIDRLLWSGDRVAFPVVSEQRIPREFRMRQYKDVEMVKTSRFKDAIDGFTPVAVEFMDGSENLFEFEHPENAMYFFGPEDGSLDRVVLQYCHRFVRIPTKHCLNISNAVATVLAHRALQITLKPSIWYSPKP